MHNRLIRAILMLTIGTLAIATGVSPAEAQEDNSFDVKVMTPAAGAAGELPVDITVNFTNGESQDLQIGQEGLYTYPGPADGSMVKSITCDGVELPAETPGTAAAKGGKGCWRTHWACKFSWWRIRCYVIYWWDPAC